jgi:hypothetical protein
LPFALKHSALALRNSPSVNRRRDCGGINLTPNQGATTFVFMDIRGNQLTVFVFNKLSASWKMALVRFFVFSKL